jgi:GMP synthase-like glutamine amidotransferase
MILIVDLNWKRGSLSFSEFVSPIISTVNAFEDCEIKHYLDIKPKELGGYSKIILSGTALRDNATLKNVEKFIWVTKFQKPILGICAGMQTINVAFNELLEPCLQVGVTEIKTLRENSLFHGNFNAYTLHNYSVASSKTFETLAVSTKCIQAIKHKQKSIYGVLFHPEVRNPEIIKRFLQVEK